GGLPDATTRARGRAWGSDRNPWFFRASFRRVGRSRLVVAACNGRVSRGRLRAVRNRGQAALGCRAASLCPASPASTSPRARRNIASFVTCSCIAQPALQERKSHDVYAVLQAELLRRVGFVGLDGLHAEVQLRGDFLVAVPPRDQPQDLLFP